MAEGTQPVMAAASASSKEAVKPTAAARKKTPRSGVQLMASAVFLLVVVFQLPFFEIAVQKDDDPVQMGPRRRNEREAPTQVVHRVAPLQVVASQLIMTKAVPEEAFKWVLYPGIALKQFRRTTECVLGYRLKGCDTDAAHFLPSWDTMLRTYNPQKVDHLMTREFKERKVQLVAGSFFCVLALAIVPICLSRLPAFGCLLYLYPLARRGLMPSPWLLLACVCSALVIHLGELHAKSLEQAGRQRKAAERKPTLDQKAALTQAAREQDRIQYEELKALTAKMEAKHNLTKAKLRMQKGT